MSAAGPPPYRVKFRTRRVQRELDSLPRADHSRIISAISGLVTQPRPRGTVQLEDGIFRIRVGNYRIIYHIEDGEHIVEIGGVRRRTERTYRDFRDLF